MLLKNVPIGSTILVEDENKEYTVGGYWWDGRQRQLIAPDSDNYIFMPDTVEVVVVEYCGL